MAPGSNVPSGVRGFGHRDALTGIRERLVVNLTLKEDKLEDLHASLELAETFDSHTAEQRTRKQGTLQTRNVGIVGCEVCVCAFMWLCVCVCFVSGAYACVCGRAFVCVCVHAFACVLWLLCVCVCSIGCCACMHARVSTIVCLARPMHAIVQHQDDAGHK